MVRIPSVLCALLALTTLVRGEEARRANRYPAYQALRSAVLSGESVPLEDAVLERELATFHFESGRLYFLEPVEGRVTGAVFVGRGSVTVRPSLKSERRQLRFLTDSDQLRDDFTRLVLRFTDETYGALTRQWRVEKGSVDPEAVRALERSRKRLRRGRRYRRPNVAAGFLRSNLDLRILIDLMREQGSGFFHAHFKGKRYGEMIYMIDPLGAPFVTPEEVVLVDLEPGSLGIWVSEHQRGQARLSEEDHSLIDVSHYRIEASAHREELQATVTARFRTRLPGLAVLPFDLFPELRVKRVSNAAGEVLDFIQEEKEKDADFAVILKQPLPEGKETRLTFQYGGKGALADSGGGNYMLVARSNWFPASRFGDRAQYDILLRVPRQLEVVATGVPVEEKREGKDRVTRWKSGVELATAGFNFGNFKKTSRREKKLDYVVETYANRELPDYLKRLQQAKVRHLLESLSTTGLMQKASGEARLSLDLFSRDFGRLPYGRIAMTQQPAANFGQAWPMLIYMPLTAFVDSTHRFELLGTTAASYFRYVGAHEVAHQWWGHLLGWKSYRDQWMSEGFAEFSASLFAQAVYGIDAFRDFWRRQRRLILKRNERGKRPSEVGSVTMGYRLDTAKTGTITRAMIYPKGAFILHMLRMMMWNPRTRDQDFMRMMQDFVASYRNTNVSTHDFQKVCERHISPALDLAGNGRLDWFFRQWVEGTTIPRYTLEYKLVDGRGGKTRLSGQVTQGDVGEEFMMRVPLYLDFGGKNSVRRLGTLTIHGNSTAKFDVMLPKRPKKVRLCWLEDVLCRTTAR